MVVATPMFRTPPGPTISAPSNEKDRQCGNQARKTTLQKATNIVSGMKQTDTTHNVLITPFSVLSFFTRYEKFPNNAPLQRNTP